MQNVVVTGATSMIGVALIEEAIENNINVYAIVRPDTARIERLPKSESIHIIYSNLDGLKDVQIPTPCDVLYHFAWTGTTKEQRDDPLINEKNIRYTLDAVELAHKSGCKKFVGAGSQAEYGPVDGIIDVNTKFAPVLSYGISKYAAGKLSRKLCDEYGIIHIWGRIFSVYGRWDNKNTLLKYAIMQFKKGEKAYFSSGKQKWNYLFERDAGRMFLAMGAKIKYSKELIIASDETRSLREFIEILCREMKCRDLCVFEDSEMIDEKICGINPDVSKTTKALNIHKFIQFKDGINMMIDACSI